MKRFLLSLCMALVLLTSMPVYAAQVERLRGVAVVDVDSLNVRSGPSRDYEKLGTLARDISVEVKGIVEPDWYVIEFEGEEGYISSEYVMKNNNDIYSYYSSLERKQILYNSSSIKIISLFLIYLDFTVNLKQNLVILILI